MTSAPAVLASVSASRIIQLLIEAYIIVLVLRALVSWFPLQPGSSLIPVARVLDRLTEPLLAPLRRVIPPLRAGGTAIDLSFIILIIVLQIVAARV
ncbi:MAG: YggT family protein [Acidimicrobiales bacterium]